MKTEQLNIVKTLHRLLFQALLEIRAQGQEQNNKVVFHLADLFHNVVLEIEQAAQSEISYEEVLRSLEEKAQEKGLSKWLETNLARLNNK